MEPRLLPMDVESRCPPESFAYAIFNDSDRPLTDAVHDAVRNYRV